MDIQTLNKGNHIIEKVDETKKLKENIIRIVNQYDLNTGSTHKQRIKAEMTSAVIEAVNRVAEKDLFLLEIEMLNLKSD